MVEHWTEVLLITLGDGGFAQVCRRQQGGKEGEVSTMTTPTALVLNGVSGSFTDQGTYQVGSPDPADASLDRDLDAL